MPDTPRDPIEQLIRGLIQRERLANTLSVEVIEEISQFYERIVDRIQRADPMGVSRHRYRRARQEDLLKEIEQLAREFSPAMEKRIKDLLAPVGRVEALRIEADLIATLGEVGGKVVTVTPVTQARVRAILNTEAFQGRTLKEHTQRLTASAYDATRTAIRQGMLAEESTADIVRRVRGRQAGYIRQDPKTGAFVAKGTRGAIVRPRFKGGVLSMSTREAESLVRTAVTHVSAMGQLETYRANGDLLSAVRYVATLDDRVTALCASLDGQEWPVDSTEIVVPGRDTHYNCVPGDTRVVSRSSVGGVSKRWFDGEVVVIKTASGRELTCTPNHPILTDEGWVAAGSLDLGSHVVADGGREWESPVEIDHDDERVPPLIHDVAEALLRARAVVAVPVPTSSEDFHGDGRDGEVAVIWSDRLLRNGAKVAEHLPQGAFGVGGSRGLSSLPGLGRETEFLEGLLPARGGPVGGAREALSLGGGGAVHPGLLLLAAVPDVDAVAREQSPHRGAADPELLGHTTGTHAVGVHGDNGLLRKVGATVVDGLGPGLADGPADDPVAYTKVVGDRADRLAARVAPENVGSVQSDATTPDGDAARLQPVGDGLDGDAHLASEIRRGATGPVFLDEVVHIEVKWFSDHVYNLETGAGFYAANGIITHNCRSTLVSVVDWASLGLTAPPDGDRMARDMSTVSDDDLDRKVSARRRSGGFGQVKRVSSGTVAEQWLREQRPAVQSRILGRGKAKLFREGKISLRDIVRDDFTTVPLRDLLAA